MKHPPPLEYDNYYHIYNRGINGGIIFREKTNYEYFLNLLSDHITPIAEIFAYALMNNHFHFLVRIFSEEEIGLIKPSERNKHIVFTEKKKYNPAQQFGNLFNAYTRAYNIKYHRSGSLFETPFRRIRVDDENYFKNLICYIHNNPVHHKLSKQINDYPWSSYLSIIGNRPTRLKREKVLEWFNSRSEFIDYHNQNNNYDEIESILTE